MAYFGHSKAEWDKLTDDEKATVKEEYQTVIDSKNEQAHADKIKERTQSVIDYGLGHGYDYGPGRAGRQR